MGYKMLEKVKKKKTLPSLWLNHGLSLHCPGLVSPWVIEFGSALFHTTAEQAGW